MERHLTIFILALFVVLFVGCNKDDPDNSTVKPSDPTQPGQPSDPTQPSQPGTYYCTTDMPDEWVLSWNESWVAFPLKTNIEDFKITISESWCTAQVQPTTTAGKKELMVTVEEYNVLDGTGAPMFLQPRKAKLRITGGGVFDRSITIVQNTHVQISTPSLSYFEGNQVLYLSADGETQTVTVTANCYSWRASTGADWLTITKMDASTLSITSTPRTSGGPRKASVSIVDEAAPMNNTCSFVVADKDAVLTGNDFDYGESTEWD